MHYLIKEKWAYKVVAYKELQFDYKTKNTSPHLFIKPPHPTINTGKNKQTRASVINKKHNYIKNLN